MQDKRAGHIKDRTPAPIFPPLAAVPREIFTPTAAIALSAAFAVAMAASELKAQGLAAAHQPGILATLWKWLPLILFGPVRAHFQDGALSVSGQLGGFSLNILVSVVVMAAGTALGIILGLALISKSIALRRTGAIVTQFFRNTPWLVLLFFATFLLPFQLHLAGYALPFPDWCKAAVALTFPIMANIAEITRGAVQSIPSSQWESAESLAFSRVQTLRLIILPQCVKRMTPPWMNWYAILAMESSLISIVGVNEAMTMTHDALSAEGRSELLIPMYGLLLLLFFAYCYPIARWTQALERRATVVG
jgi:polar amino acid transport system permease protein